MKHVHIPELILERYLLKELPEDRIKMIEDLIKKNPALQKKIEKLKKSNAEILNSYPVNEISTRIIHLCDLEKSHTKNIIKLSKLFYRFIIPSLAAAAIFIFVLPASRIYDHEDIKFLPELTRIKGLKSSIYIYRKKNNDIEMLKNGSIVKKGDLLQIAYVSTEDKYGIILSIDGRGIVTLHYPSDNNSTELIIGKKILLGKSYELDDAPGFERFFLITSKLKLNINSILNAAEVLAHDRENVLYKDIEIKNAENNSVNQTSILLMK